MNRLSQYCSSVVEFGWLFVLACVPLYINQTMNPGLAELGKSGLFRTVVLLMTLAWLVKAAVGGNGDRPAELAREADADDRPGWRRIVERFPVEAALGLFAVVQVVSTFTSIEPLLSLKGTYEWSQGAQTLLAWATFALLIAAELKTNRQLERLTTVILLTSIPAALYGLLQMQRLDPLRPGQPPVTDRAASSIGNPIWFGAYLVTVIPLAAWRLARAARDWRMRLAPPGPRAGVAGTWSWALPLIGVALTALYAWLYLWFIGWSNTQMAMFGREGGWWALGGALSVGAFVAILLAPIGERIRPELRVAGFTALLLLLLAALLGAASRGPAVGIVAAVLSAAVIAGLRWRRRALWQGALALAVAGACLVVLVNLPNSPLGGLRQLPFGVGRLLSFQTGGSLEMGEKVPAGGRFLIWGAALQLIVSPTDGGGNGLELPPAVRPLLGYGPDTFGDIFQRTEPPELANTTSRQTVFDRAHSQWIDVLVQTGLLGLLGYFGFMVGAVWVGLRALWRTRDPNRQIFLVAATAGLIGHFVEAQSGLQIISTEVNVAAYLAMLAAAGHVAGLGVRGRDRAPVRPAAEPLPAREEPATPELAPEPVGAAFSRVQARRAATAGVARSAVAVRGGRSDRLLEVWPAEQVVWVGFSVAVTLMGLAFLVFVNTPNAQIVPPLLMMLSTLPVLLLGGGSVQAGEPGLVRVTPALPPRVMLWWPVLLVVAMLGPFFLYWNVVPLGTDVLYRKAAGVQTRARSLPANDIVQRGAALLQATGAYRDVVLALPHEDWYYFFLADAFVDLAQLRPVVTNAMIPFTISWDDAMFTPLSTLAQAGRAELMLSAQAVLQEMVDLRPANANYNAQLARHYVKLATQVGDASAPVLAVAFYERAVELAPYHVVYRMELADLYGSMRRYEDALAMSDSAVARDPLYWRAHWGRALALEKLERPQEAMAAAKQAQQLFAARYDVATPDEQRLVNETVQRLEEALAGGGR